MASRRASHRRRSTAFASLPRRSTALAARWLAAALIVACVEGPTDPGHFGELRVRPSYAQGDGPVALGFTVDSAHVRIARQSEPNAPLFDGMVGYSSDTVSLGWLLDLRDEQETMQVDVTIWDDGQRLYSGQHAVQVRDGSIGEIVADHLVAYVGPAIVSTVDVTPQLVVLEALGETATLRAEARDRHNAVVQTSFTWSTGDAGVVVVDPAGVVTAVANGSTTLQASAGGKHGSTTVTVDQRVRTLAITPATTTLSTLGATEQLHAMAKDSRGHDVADATFEWSSSNPSVARVDAATGLVTAVSGGSATITVRSDTAFTTSQVTVNPTANVATISVAPSTATLTSVGTTRQFTAEARDANGNVLAGVQFTWSSSATDVASIDAAGLARAVAHGATTITATAGSVSGTATLAVNLSASIASVSVSPGSVTLTSVGATQQFTAVARDGGGNVVPVTTFTWSSSAPDVASVDPVSGVATAASHGATTVNAAVGGVSGTASLTVSLATSIATVTVSPATSSLTSVGATQQFTAVARDAIGNVVPVSAFVWSSSNPQVAAVDANGLATAQAHGSTTISAAVGQVNGTASLVVNLSASIATVTVTPANATLTSIGATQQFTAVARDGGGNVVPVTTFTWSGSAPDVASVDPVSGVATAASHGATTISATVGTVTGDAALSVNLTSRIAAIEVSPNTAIVSTVGATRQFTAVARDANGGILPGVPFTWSSETPSVATIDPASGLATALAHGTTTVTASAGATTGTATLTVNLAAVIASVEVTPGSATLTAVGATQQFSAQARDANGTVVPVATFAWSSSAPEVATVGATTGLAAAAAHGTTSIVASVGSVSGSATLAVNLTSTVASVVVLPDKATLTAIGATQQYTAVARDDNGAVVPGMVFEWSSSQPLIASIDPVTGLATAVCSGEVIVTAVAGNVGGTATLTISLPENAVARTRAQRTPTGSRPAIPSTGKTGLSLIGC